MSSNYYKTKLEAAIVEAIDKKSFDKRNILNDAKAICIFGVGKYFNEAYEQYFLNKNIKVDYLCDNNEEKWGKEYKGIKCISPEELTELKDIVVIPLIGDLKAIQAQLEDMNIKHINPNALFFDMIVNLPLNREWFVENFDKLLKAYDILSDDTSKHIYMLM